MDFKIPQLTPYENSICDTNNILGVLIDHPIIHKKLACISPTACHQKADHDEGNDIIEWVFSNGKKVDSDIESKDSIYWIVQFGFSCWILSHKLGSMFSQCMSCLI